MSFDYIFDGMSSGQQQVFWQEVQRQERLKDADGMERLLLQIRSLPETFRCPPSELRMEDWR